MNMSRECILLEDAEILNELSLIIMETIFSMIW